MRRLVQLAQVVMLVTATGSVFAGTIARSIKIAALAPPSIEGQVVVLVDANGEEIAPVMDVLPSGTEVNVPIKVSGVTAILRVGSSAVVASVGGNGDTVYFESADCSGQPIVSAVDLLPITTAVSGPGQTLYVQNEDAVRQEFLLGSLLSNQGTCQPTDGAAVGFEAHAVVRLDLIAPPPYTLKLKKH